MYRCNYCKKTFGSRKEIRDHVKQIHKKKRRLNILTADSKYERPSEISSSYHRL